AREPDHGRVLRDGCRVVAVHRDRRHERVVRDVTERVDRRADDPWYVAARVDDRVEAPSGECAEVAVAVADELLGLGKELRAGVAAVEECDLVSARECLRDDVPAEELRAAEDEQLHRLETMPTTIRHAEPSDYGRVITVIDEWWGGRRMAPMLPKLFF